MQVAGNAIWLAGSAQCVFVICMLAVLLDSTCDGLKFKPLDALAVMLPQCAVLLQAWGYKDVQAYYNDINGLKWIPKISTPTLFLSAEDDPFLGYRCLCLAT